MKILVTGGSGFIGSHLCEELLKGRHEIAVLVRDARAWRVDPWRDRALVLVGELGSPAGWRQAVADFAPDAIAHLAWEGVAGRDRNSASQIANIAWSADLMEIAHRAGATTFLGLGSQAEYGPREGAIAPDAPASPTTLYGEAKLATGRLLARLAEGHGMRFVWMRVFSTYGPGDNPHWMIPSLIGELAAGKRPALTAAEQRWDFLYVRDAARAIRLAIETHDARGVYNLGSGSAPSLRSTAEFIRDAVDPSLPLGLGDIPYRPDQVMHLEADISRLRSDLGWEPEIPLDKGLAETVRWYLANRWIYGEARAG